MGAALRRPAAVDGDRLIGPLFAATSLLTFADLMFYGSLGFTSPALELILVARSALLIWCTAHELPPCGPNMRSIRGWTSR